MLSPNTCNGSTGYDVSGYQGPVFATSYILTVGVVGTSTSLLNASNSYLYARTARACLRAARLCACARPPLDQLLRPAAGAPYDRWRPCLLRMCSRMWAVSSSLAAGKPEARLAPAAAQLIQNVLASSCTPPSCITASMMTVAPTISSTGAAEKDKARAEALSMPSMGSLAPASFCRYRKPASSKKPTPDRTICVPPLLRVPTGRVLPGADPLARGRCADAVLKLY